MKNYYEFGHATFTDEDSFHDWFWKNLEFDKNAKDSVPNWYRNTEETLYLLCQIFGRVSNGINDRTFDTEIETFLTKDEVEPHIKITFTDYNEHGEVSDAYTETYIIPVNSVIMERENVTYFYKEKDGKGGK